jgi:DNA-binding MarR family transcriptional regulator
MRNDLSSRLHELEHYLTVRRIQKEIAEHFAVDRKSVCRAIDKLDQSARVSEEKADSTWFISLYRKMSIRRNLL